MSRIYLLTLCGFLGCTKASVLQDSRWSGEGERPSLSTESLTAPTEWRSGMERVQLSEQIVGNYPVENSFVKRVYKGDDVIFQSFALATEVPLEILEEAHSLNSHKEAAWDLFLKRNNVYRKWKVEGPSKVLLTTSPKLMAVLSTVLESGGEIFEVRTTASGSLIQKSRLGSNLTDLFEVTALAYPRGPKKSDLSKITLEKLAMPEGLANRQIEVKTESPNKIVQNQDLELPPTDDRFDQIQSYYFANQILGWFERKLVLKGPLKLSILANVGYPEKTNTAFYYNGQIRLGAGDDITFSKIPWDPSIVMHEVSHALIDQLAHLPFQGEGGSLNEGFADVFTTFYLESPYLGDNAYKKGAYKRSVVQPVRLADKNGGLYHDSAIVSSFFWNLRNVVGAEKSLVLALRTLNRLGPNSKFQDFVLTLKEQSPQIFSGDQLSKAQDLMKDWGFL